MWNFYRQRNNSVKKSRISLKLLEFFLKNLVPFEDQENLEGDFAEMFERISHQKGKIRAIGWYIIQISKLLPSYFKNYTTWSLTMISNYLKIAARNIKKYKTYSFINITGLAIGMACVILILLFIQDELSYDRFHEKADRIYRIVDSFDVSGGFERDFAFTSAPFAPTLKQDFPEVEDAVRLLTRRHMVTYEDKKYFEDFLFYADASVFNIFTFPLVVGSPETALAAPNTIVISESTALKYFGKDDAVNKTLNINDQDYVVTGIMKDMPKNSHFYAQIFASMKTFEKDSELQEQYFQSWARHEFYTYLLLHEDYNPEDVQAKFPAFIEKYAAQQIKTILGGSLSSRLQPLKSIHLHSHLQMEISPNGDIKYVAIFSVIALFILLIACVNFINLATARSVNRSKEVGLRKVVGASRYQLIQQFLGESLFFTLVALILALILIVLALPFFNSLTGKEIELNNLINLFLFGSMVLILFLVGMLSGSYPAFFISRYQPTHALKKGVNISSGKSYLRKGLVIFQFTLSIILFIATAVVLDQLDFLRNRKLGFNKEHVIVVPIRSNSIRNNAEAIKAELLQNSNIISGTITIGVPGGIVAGDAIKLVTEEGKKTMTLRMIYTDHDYVKTMGMEIVEGRDFSKYMSSDASEAFLINEAAVRELQLENPTETQVEWGGSDYDYGIEKKGRIIGVVKDFQFQSLRDAISPLIIHVWSQNTFVFALRILPDDISGTLAFIEGKWKELDPAHPFEYSFMDETFDRLYRSEENLGKIFTVFSMLAIFIAALGLFGLALFMAQQKTKEIGVRKVLGASVGNIFTLLSKEFAILVLLANIFAWPTAYILMQEWLQNFAYRVRMEPRIFVLAAFLAFVIALVTISFQAIKAALANPIESLRYE
jgi:putative ABC transport system permease protein